MHPLAKLLLDGSERRSHPLGDGDPSDREPPVTPRLCALVREAEEVKRFRATFATHCATFDRVATELDQPRLVLVQLQAELGAPQPEFFQARYRFASMFKANHEVVRIADDDDVAPAAVLPPPLHPQVQDVVQEHVRQQR
jgi:hypothetical protein